VNKFSRVLRAIEKMPVSEIQAKKKDKTKEEEEEEE